MGNRFLHPGRATIRDVAAAAGVSKATASKYVSGGNYYVSAETRNKIDAAIRELDYEPNTLAQSLANSRTFTIGVVVASLRNPFYPELVAGIEEVTEAAGYTLLLSSTESDPHREQRIVQAMLQRQVDGVVMASVRMKATDVERLQSRGLRVVLASRDLPGVPADTVVIDNQEGGRLAAGHLAEHGHRRIGLIAGSADIRPFVDRELGFREEMAARQLPVDEAVVVHVESNVHDGERVMTHLLDAATPPTAVFVCSDELALGALDAIEARGLSVPDEVALVGFDNIAFSSRARVPLTTVNSHAHELGSTAAHQLLQRIDGELDAAPSRLLLRPELVRRRSCGCPTPTRRLSA